MVTSILAALTQIKADIAVLLQADTIEWICRDLKYTWRDRLLSPVVTVHGFLLQVLHGNTACDHVPHLLGGSFVSFRKGRLPKGRIHVPPRPCGNGFFKHVTGLPRSRWVRWLGRLDQVVEYFRPKAPPKWITAEAYAALPDSILVREVRFRILIPGCRTKEVTLVTNLLDAERYPAAELAQKYYERWQVEVNLRHLQQTLHLDVLHCKTVAGVRKELCMMALVYNLVRLVMCTAAHEQQVPPDRISFIDALRWLNHATPGEPLPKLIVLPIRQRVEPRVRKRRPKQYDLMTKPRESLRQALASQ